MAFQPTRFIHPTSCLAASCALTARFHPYPERVTILEFGFTINELSPNRNSKIQNRNSLEAVIFCDTICPSEFTISDFGITIIELALNRNSSI